MKQLASKENRIKRYQSGLTRSPLGNVDHWILNIFRSLAHRDFDASGKINGYVIEFITESEDTDI